MEYGGPWTASFKLYPTPRKLGVPGQSDSALLLGGECMMKSDKTVREIADIEGVSITRIHALLKQDRIVGATRYGLGRGFWLIPVKSDGKPEYKPSKKRVRNFTKIETE